MEKLNELIEFYEMVGTEPQLLVWLLELRRHRESNWKQRAEAAEAKLAELAKQGPRYQIQKKPSYGRESVWIDVASREEAETNVLHGYRWRMVYDALAPAADRVPEGWKLVPVEPTEEMIAAGDQFMDGLSRLGDAYDAMLAVAPEVG